jgi:hypothetical protein
VAVGRKDQQDSEFRIAKRLTSSMGKLARRSSGGAQVLICRPAFISTTKAAVRFEKPVLAATTWTKKDLLDDLTADELRQLIKVTEWHMGAASCGSEPGSAAEAGGARSD